MRMVFIICEANVEDRVIESLLEIGVPGYTRTTATAEGFGIHGRREGSAVWPGYNSTIITVVPDDVSAVISETMAKLREERQGRLAIHVYSVAADVLL